MAQPNIKGSPTPPNLGGGGGGGNGNGKCETEDERLLRELAEAQAKLEGAEAELTKYQERLKLQDAVPKIIDDYKEAYPQLKRDEGELRDFRDHEKAALEEILTKTLTDKIDKIAKQAEDEIGRITKRIKEATDKLKAWRDDVKVKKDAVDAKKAELEALKKPAATFGDRLKKAATTIAEVQKAHGARKYALAYWLLTSCRKLRGQLGDKEFVISPEQLAQEVEAKGMEYFKAVADAAELDAKIKAREAALKADEDLLAERTKSFDARIAQELSDIHPPHPVPVPPPPPPASQQPSSSEPM